MSEFKRLEKKHSIFSSILITLKILGSLGNGRCLCVDPIKISSFVQRGIHVGIQKARKEAFYFFLYFNNFENIRIFGKWTMSLRRSNQNIKLCAKGHTCRNSKGS